MKAPAAIAGKRSVFRKWPRHQRTGAPGRLRAAGPRGPPEGGIHFRREQGPSRASPVPVRRVLHGIAFVVSCLRRTGHGSTHRGPRTPSGGRAARGAQAEFTSAVSKARVVQAPCPYGVSCTELPSWYPACGGQGMGQRTGAPGRLRAAGPRGARRRNSLPP